VPHRSVLRQALAKALGIRPLQTLLSLRAGPAVPPARPAETACTALVTAIALYCAMDMTLWLLQAEATLAQVEGQ
jgi:hypothetical protein